MTQTEFGKLIARLRKEAGYTQQSLADALLITDKAVSKWERGICAPDSAILPKLAGLLNTDLGSLVPDAFDQSDWTGLLLIEPGETDDGTEINGKPLLHYLLSYFLLLGITEIEIRGVDEKRLSEYRLEQYGFHLRTEADRQKKTMVVFGKNLIFGAYLTKQLQNMMAAEENIIPTADGIKVPMIFVHGPVEDLSETLEEAKYRSLYRGTVRLPLDSPEEIADAETFIRIYEKYHHVSYCDLAEIAAVRGIESAG